MKNVYISTSVHVRRLSGQTKQEKFANIQPTFFVRILEPIWASFFDVDILQRLSIKVKGLCDLFLAYVILLIYLLEFIASNEERERRHTIRVGFFRAFTCHSGCHIFSYYSSRFFSRVYLSLWMPYIFILFESVFFARLRVTLDAIYFHSFDAILDWLVGTFDIDLMW